MNIKIEQLLQSHARWANVQIPSDRKFSELIHKLFPNKASHIEFTLMRSRDPLHETAIGIQISIPSYFYPKGSFRRSVRFKDGIISFEHLQKKYDEVLAEIRKIEEQNNRINKKNEQMQLDRDAFEKQANQLFGCEKNTSSFYHHKIRLDYQKKEITISCEDEKTMMKLLQFCKDNL